MLKRLLPLLLALLLAACGGQTGEDVSVVIQPGSSLRSAATALEEAGAVGSAAGFLNYARVFGSDAPIKPGEYAIKKGMSSGEILSLLQEGKTLQRFVTVTPGMPSILVYERLKATPHLTGDVEVPAEGSVLPDSYAYTSGEKRSALLERMQLAMTRTLAKLWAERSAATVVNSPQDAIILAGIVEKETGKASERRTVAGVYSNRLKTGMRLQADPTVIYPVTKGKPLGRRILRSELRADNGYNTYARAGLPAGPITNPGKDSIAAVLNPAPTRYVYFVADGTGGHVFAETLAEHNANVEKWYTIRKSRGEM